MKNLFFVLAIIFYLNGYSQKSFTWDIIDSVNKSKVQIYNDSKLFIAETWKSANDVIQNDDKESGVILLKGITTYESFFMLSNHKWVFRYTIKILIKENKFRFILENVYCESAYCETNEWPKIPIGFEWQGYKKCTMSETRYLNVMNVLHENLQNIVNQYVSNIKKESVINGDW